jgi:hypothetical protein
MSSRRSDAKGLVVDDNADNLVPNQESTQQGEDALVVNPVSCAGGPVGSSPRRTLRSCVIAVEGFRAGVQPTNRAQRPRPRRDTPHKRPRRPQRCGDSASTIQRWAGNSFPAQPGVTAAIL